MYDPHVYTRTWYGAMSTMRRSMTSAYIIHTTLLSSRKIPIAKTIPQYDKPLSNVCFDPTINRLTSHTR